MIHVIATIELSAGGRDSFLAEFRQLVPKVLQEEGCIEYGPTIDVETQISAQPPPRADVVTVVEKWANLECLEAHLIAPHTKEFRGKVQQFVERTTLFVLQPV